MLAAALLLGVAAAAPARAGGTTPSRAPAAAAPAGTAGPIRIGVAGTWPTGYAGFLARYGMPRRMLIDYQLTDPAVLSQYDLVLVGGLPPLVADKCRPAIEALLAKGGSIFVDGSAPGTTVIDWIGARCRGSMNDSDDGSPAPLGLGELSGHPALLRLCGKSNPLGDEGDDTIAPRFYRGYLLNVTDPSKAEVLGECVRANEATPDIVLYKQGKGKLMLCGAAIGSMTSHEGGNFDRLLLRVVRYLSDGRAVPQFEPDGPRLIRHQSMRGLHLMEKSPDMRAARDPITERPEGAGARGPLPKGFTVLDEDPAVEFNVTGKVDGDGDVVLNYWSPAHYLKVAFTGRGVQIARTVAGRTRVIASSGKAIPAGTPFVIKERESRVAVVAGDASASASVAGICRGQAAGRGKLSDLHYQPVEAVWFSDDFMRTSQETGGWEVASGKWTTAPLHAPETSANPFCYRVAAAATPADSLYGYSFWDEYRCSVSVRVDLGQGPVGVGVYARDAANMIRFQARVTEDGAPAPDGFTLVRIVDGKQEVLDKHAGGLRPAQWYRMQIAVRDGEVSAAIDGVRVVGARVPGAAGGKIDLHAENTTARFDDVLVTPADVPVGPVQRVADTVTPTTGFLDLDTWAGQSAQWEADPTAPGLFWRRGSFFGPVDLRYDIGTLPPNGQVMLLVDGDGESTASGYSLWLQRTNGDAKLELRRGNKVVARAAGISPEKLELCLRREDRKVVGLVNDKELVATRASNADAGGRVAFRAAGFLPHASGLSVLSANILNYSFDLAPVDWWVGDGKWDLITRWSCEPQWSWYGCSFGDVSSIWHKRPLEGDAVMDVYLGIRTPDGKPWWEDRTEQLNATLCGDGKDVKSGYSFVVGDTGGGAKLYRAGKLVAENKEFKWYRWGHNRWQNVRVEKHGGRIELFVEGQQILRYDDPHPLPGGYPAVWTHDNAVVIPYVALYFQKLGDKVLGM